MPTSDPISDPQPAPSHEDNQAGREYFARRLSGHDPNGHPVRFEEAELAALGGACVVLGEPGMGKSALIGELGRLLDARPVSAVRFLNAKDPLRLVQTGKPALIDGLDEAVARRDGDAVDAILAQLEAAGAPPFVLSCRSREWQARSERDLKELYGTDPHIVSIEPFTRHEALDFLAARHPLADTNKVLSHLENHGLHDLYTNPLTLGLMGRVAETDKALPASRAALFERVCVLLWPEHDPNRQDSGLAQLNQSDGLSAAGAIAAALLFAGAEAVSAAGAAEVQDGDVRISDIEKLPGAGAARTVYSSKLFRSVGPGRAKPIHRVVAEYLAARWLVASASTPRSQRRLIAQLHGNGGIPASLRGLHAWLAYHAPPLAERIIAADPYGVLRYGETSALNSSDATCLFEALEALATDDPYFRSNDWDRRTASGLMIGALGAKVAAVIDNQQSNSHLRSLLIEGLEGTALAATLAPTLAGIVFSPGRYYRERYDAVNALLPHRDRFWWHEALETVSAEGSDDASRLVRHIIESIDADVSDVVFVRAIFAELGLLFVPLPRVKKRRVHTLRHYGHIASLPAAVRLPAILALIEDYVQLIPRGDYQSSNDIADLMAHLLVRAIDEGAIGSSDGPRLWSWLGVVKNARSYRRDIDKELIEALKRHPEVRHAAQEQALYTKRAPARLLFVDNEMRRRLIDLRRYDGDVTLWLERMQGADNRVQALRDDWRDLMTLAHGAKGYAPGALKAGRAFMRRDAQLAAILKRLENPRPSAWEKHEARTEAKRARKKRVSFEFDRRRLAADRADLLAGSLQTSYDTALVYLGLDRDTSEAEAPLARLEEWLGPALAVDTLTGLEAVLHRGDLPGPANFAQGFADNRPYKSAFPLIAGLYERIRSGRGLAGVRPDVLTSALLISRQDEGWNVEADAHKALRAALEAALLGSTPARVQFAKTWIEPVLNARKDYAPGLYMLTREPAWQAAGQQLAEQWLKHFSDLPGGIEDELINCLISAGSLPQLAAVAKQRNAGVYPNFDRMLRWLAVEVVTNFQTVTSTLASVGDAHPELLFYLRTLLTRERHAAALPLTAAQSAWIFATFRAAWPNASYEDEGDGDMSPYDGADFLLGLASRLAGDVSEVASEALSKLIGGPHDGYTDSLRHMAAEQRQKRAEEGFTALATAQLGAVLSDGAPSNAEDLKALVLEELAVAQAKLLGEDIDQVRDFWTDAGIPRDENRCRDRLAAMIGPELARYHVQRITEADMPATKRVDLAFCNAQTQLPMEVKGHWHPEVWDAASGQLDAQYLIDWRSDQRGIYCVLWFGNLAAKTGHRLKKPPAGSTPKTPEEMRVMLISRIPPARRPHIDVVVLDLVTGKR